MGLPPLAASAGRIDAVVMTAVSPPRRLRLSTVLLALSVVLGAVLVSAPAQALTSSRTDPANDVPGPLDIVRIAFRGDPGSLGAFTIRTSERWGCAFLRREVKTDLQWRFDGDADGDIDLVGRFTCLQTPDGRRLIFMLRGIDSGNRYEPVRATRPDRRSVRVRFPLDLTEIDGPHLRAVVRSSDAITEGCAETCVDRAPDIRKFRVY